MTLADLTWQLNSGVVLNDDSFGAPFVDITGVTGLDNAPYRETIRDHEGMDGGYIDAEFESGRDIILNGIVYAADADSLETYLDSLKANFAPVTSPVPLVFKPAGLSERVLFVKPRGCRYDWDTAYRLGVVNIQFSAYAEDPRIYDNNLVGTVIPYGGPATTGFSFNLGFNLDFGVVVPVTGGNVVVTGNRPTPAIMTLTGPAVSPRIINTTDGLSLDFDVELGASDVMVIDLANHTVTINGQNARTTLERPDWWLFNPGTTFMVLGGVSGSGSLLVQYRNAWR